MAGSGLLEGRCMCGAVTLRIEPARTDLHACHCEMCRRWTGSALIEIGVDDDKLEVAGPVRTIASSDWAERAWCDGCGSCLWYRMTLPGKEHYAVSAGLFDNAGGFPLTKEIFIDCKPEGYAFAGERTRLTKQEVEAAWAAAGADEAS